MIRRPTWAMAAALIPLIAIGLVIRNQVEVYQNRLASETRARSFAAGPVPEIQRQSLLDGAPTRRTEELHARTVWRGQ